MRKKFICECDLSEIQRFKNYDNFRLSRMLGGGRIPTRQDFDRAKRFLKTQNKKSVTWTD